MSSPVPSLASSLPTARSAGPAPTPQPSTSFRSLLGRTNPPAPADASAAESRRAEARKPSDAARSRRADRKRDSGSTDDARTEEADDDNDVKRTRKRAEAGDASVETAPADAPPATPADADDGSVDPEGSADQDAQAAAAACAAADAQQNLVTAVPADAKVEIESTDAVLNSPAAALNVSAEVGTEIATEGDLEGLDAAGASADTGFALSADLSGNAEEAATEGQTPTPPRPAAVRPKGMGLGTGGLGQPSPNAEVDADAEARANAEADVGATSASMIDAALSGEAAPAAPITVEASGEKASKAVGDRGEGLLPPQPDLSTKALIARSAAPSPAVEVPPEVRFAELNHDKVVTGVRAELLPNGGSMQIRLDPPELGDLLVSIQIRDGVMTAAFQTSNDKTSTLLSHSLTELKASLEAQGVSVDRLHVQQTPKDPADAGHGGQPGGSHQFSPDGGESGRREQQRKDMVQRMWQKLMGGGDPIDLVA